MINELRDLIKNEIQCIYNSDLVDLELVLPCKLKIRKNNKVTYDDIIFKYPSIRKIKDKITVLFNIEVESDLNNILQKIVYDYLESKNITTIKGNIILDLYVVDKKEYLNIIDLVKDTISSKVAMRNKTISEEALDNSILNIGETIISYIHSDKFKENNKKLPYFLNHSEIIHKKFGFGDLDVVGLVQKIHEEISIYDIDQYEELLFSMIKNLDESDFSEILSNYVEIYNYKAKFKEVNKLSLFLSLVENIMFTKYKFNRYQDLFTVEDVSNNLLISNIKRGVENCD